MVWIWSDEVFFIFLFFIFFLFCSWVSLWWNPLWWMNEMNVMNIIFFFRFSLIFLFLTSFFFWLKLEIWNPFLIWDSRLKSPFQDQIQGHKCFFYFSMRSISQQKKKIPIFYEISFLLFFYEIQGQKRKIKIPNQT